MRFSVKPHAEGTIQFSREGEAQANPAQAKDRRSHSTFAPRIDTMRTSAVRQASPTARFSLATVYNRLLW